MLPFEITVTISLVCLMLRLGSLFRIRRSALFPTSILPILLSKLKNLAGVIVAAFIASMGVKPASTNNSSSL